ncbi:MAG TPA: hypothetical protein VFT45_10060 [Longimicrobium sp.]|nr:hypothetical protein [Longimicrobium sp.]
MPSIVRLVWAGVAAAAMLAVDAVAQTPPRQETLDTVRSVVTSREKAYTDSTRAQALALLDSIGVRSDALSDLAFELQLSRVVALADNGHSLLSPRSRIGRSNRVGLRLLPLSDGLLVARAVDDLADLLGASLVSIGDLPVERLLAENRALFGGTAAWRDGFAPYLLESPEQLHALGLAASPAEAVYRFRLPDGTVVSRTLRGDTVGREVARSVDRAFLADEGHAGWRTLLTNAPWALREPAVAFRRSTAWEPGVFVFQMRQNYDAPGQAMAAVLDSVRAEIAAAHPRHLVLDMRFNGGGDLNLTRRFMQELPGLVPGRIFVLTSPMTFSAGISSVGYLTQAAPDRVTIVGEPVGDRLVFFAEARVQALPGTDTGILFSRERHDYQGGCATFTDCHGPVRRNPIRVPTLDPRVPAPWTLAAYREGRDPAMEAVHALLEREGPM